MIAEGTDNLRIFNGKFTETANVGRLMKKRRSL